MKPINRIFLVLLLALLPALVAVGQEAYDPYTHSLEENIAYPAVPKRAKEYVKGHMDQLRRDLVKKGLDAKPVRDEEVLKVTVQCDDLFVPNSEELKRSGMDKLRGFSMVASHPERYRVLVAVYTDDTGDDQYADSISTSRGNNIDAALWEIGGHADDDTDDGEWVVVYGMGKDSPVAPNTSREGRARNRRVEFYIVPQDGLINLATGKRK